MKKVLIAIHGFGKRRSNDFEYLTRWAEEKEDFEFVSFDMYDHEKKEAEWLHWVAKAKQTLDEYEEKETEVILLGFSMGGVIASFLASFCHVDKLILIAPSFEFIDIAPATRLLTQYARLLNKSETEFRNYMDERMLDYAYFPQFVELTRKLRPAIKKVTCPTLILQGMHDEFVPQRSARYAYRSLKSKRKQLIYLEEASHEVLENERCREDAFQLIHYFIEDQLVTREIEEKE